MDGWVGGWVDGWIDGRIDGNEDYKKQCNNYPRSDQNGVAPSRSPPEYTTGCLLLYLRRR